MKLTANVAVVGFAMVLLSGCATGAVLPSVSQSLPPATAAPATRASSSAPPTTASAVPPSTQASTPLSTPAPLVPEELRFRWTGPLRDVPDITPRTNFAGLEISGHTTWFYPYTQGDGPDLRSTTSSSSTDQLTFVTVADGAGCHVSDTGIYSYTLDAGKSRLSLTPLNDACQARSDALLRRLGKERLPRSARLVPGLPRRGRAPNHGVHPLYPGDELEVRLRRDGIHRSRRLVNPEDQPGGYRLEQQGAPEFTAIYVFADVLAHSQAPDCPQLPDTTVGTSAGDLTDWLTKLPSVTTTNPSPVAIGGLSGSTLDVSIDPSWTHACPYNPEEPGAPLFSNADSHSDFDWGLAGDGHMRLFLLALPDDRTLLVDIESTSKQTWDAFLPAAMPIVESFAFSQ